LIRGQKISAEDQSRFCKYFGELELVKSVPSQIAEQPHVLFVTNVRDAGLRTVLEDGEMHFHSDQCYYEVPCKATTLNAIEIPPVGGNTMFANCYRAYETLPESMKKKLAGKKALTVYDYGASPTLRGTTVNPDAPQWPQPIVRRHPETGRLSLFCNRLMTFRIEGMDPQESKEILDFLFEHQEKPEFVYEHRWTVGDLLMWDNRCTLHARRDFDPKSRRMLRRITIRGDGPVALAAA
jgi:taurine dioxygenase